MLERLVGKTMAMINYPVGDFLIRIKNAAIAKHKEVVVVNTKLVHSVAKALERSGYLSDVTKEAKSLVVKLVFSHKEPLLMDIQLVSKPGLRIYMNVDELRRIKDPYLYIISTPIGVLSSSEAIKKNAGGEVIAKIL